MTTWLHPTSPVKPAAPVVAHPPHVGSVITVRIKGSKRTRRVLIDRVWCVQPGLLCWRLRALTSLSGERQEFWSHDLEAAVPVTEAFRRRKRGFTAEPQKTQRGTKR